MQAQPSKPFVRLVIHFDPGKDGYNAAAATRELSKGVASQFLSMKKSKPGQS